MGLNLARIYISNNIEQMDQIQPQQHLLLTIKKNSDQKQSFFSDPSSPYQSLPASIRDIFSPQPNAPKTIKIAQPLRTFPAMPGLTHICTRIFPNGTSYYTCRECCNQNKPGVTMCFCESCWEPEKHIGHNFRQSMSSGGAYCDCGRQQRIKPQSFCKTHMDKSPRVLTIPESQQKPFFEYFTCLFLCSLYFKTNESSKRHQKQLQVLLNKSIETLCTGSLYYIRLISQVFKQEVEINGEKKLMLDWVLKFHKGAEKMFFSLLGDNLFKVDLVRAWIRLGKQGWVGTDLRLVQSQMYETDDIFFTLAEFGQFVSEKRSKYFDIATRSEAGIKLLQSFLYYQKTQLKPHEWLPFVLGSHSQKTTNFFLANPKVSHFLLQNLLVSDYNQATNMNADRKNTAISITSILLLSIVGGKLGKLGDLYLQDIVVSDRMEGLDRFLRYFISNVRYFVFRGGEKRESWIMVPLGLIAKSPNRDALISQLWTSLVEPDEDLRQDLVEIIVSIYHMSAIITNSPLFFNQLLQPQPSTQSLQTLYSQKQSYIKSYLYENPQISRTQLLSMRQKQYFKFPNSSHLLQKLCVYNATRDIFQYISEQKYPNYALRFKQQRGTKDLASIPAANFKFSDQFRFGDKKEAGKGDKEVQEILGMLFGGDQFVSIFCGRWWSKYEDIKKVQERIGFWTSSDLGFYYALTLVYANVFSNKNNKKLQQQLSKIRQNPQTRAIIFSLTSNPSQIARLLQIDQQKQYSSPQKAKSNSDDETTKQKLSQEQEKKKIFSEKKQRLKEKFQKSAEKFMSKEDKESSEEEHQCIICREPNKDNDKLMYICNFEKNASISYCFYGAQDKAEVNIGSCFHLIHSQCFLGINKSGFDFNCPLCTRKSNIYLPTSQKDKKSIKRCGNMINAIEVVKYKNADFGSLLIVYLKHLIGSYGLNSIVSTEFYEREKQRMRKIDHIVLKMAQQLADGISATEFEEFEQEFSLLERSFQQCQKEGLKIIQKLFAKVLYNKVLKKQQIIDEALLKQVHQKIIPEEFIKIKNILEELSESKVDFTENQVVDGKMTLSVGFKKLYPPSSTNQFQNFSSKFCNICLHAQTTNVCMLCAKSFCDTCLKGQDHMKQHSSSYLAIDLTRKKLSIRQLGGKVNGLHHIYFDSFMSTYEDRQKYHSEQNYYLNKTKMQKLLMSYIMRTEIK